MSNFDERLTAELVKLQGRAIKDWESDIAKAKKALTSLIKELVAEVKPGYDAVRESGRDEAIDEFEQNILKELEGNNENNSISGQAIRI